MGKLPRVLSNKSLLWFQREWKTWVWSIRFTRLALLAMLLGKYWMLRDSRRCMLAHTPLVWHLWGHRVESWRVYCHSNMGELSWMPSSKSWLLFEGRWKTWMCLSRHWEPTLLEMLLGEYWMLRDSWWRLLAYTLLVWLMRWYRIEPWRIFPNDINMGKLSIMLGRKPITWFDVFRIQQLFLCWHPRWTLLGLLLE